MDISHSGTIQFNRFDLALYQWIETDDSSLLQQIKKDCPKMIEMLGKALFQTDSTDNNRFYATLINYYSEPTLKSLYRDAISFYSNDAPVYQQVSKELAEDFERLKALFPEMQIPAMYMHVSGLQQNFIVADSLLSCSIDKYLGSEYALYKDFMPYYMRKSMTSERLVADCLRAWLQSEYPFNGKDNVLIDRMIYEGKILYVLTQITDDYSFEKLTSTSKEEFQWCQDYEKALWTAIIERKHLFTPDLTTTAKYFQPSPSTFISDKAPGGLGYFIGFRIVEKYMKKTGSKLPELMQNINYQDILRLSGYKP